MNKKELVKAMAQKGRLKQCQGRRAVDALMDIIGEELKRGKRVKLMGIGTFEVRERKERGFVNPRTQKSTLLKQKKSPAFYASTILKGKVKGNQNQGKPLSDGPFAHTGSQGMQQEEQYDT